MKRLLIWIGSLLMLMANAELHARAEKSMMGAPLPEMTVDFLGEKPQLRGKPLIVEFWATWCPPCRQSVPHLNKIYRKYKDRGLEIVGITKEDASKVDAFRKSVPIDYHVATDPLDSFCGQFQITGIPHALMVSTEGTIVWEGHPLQLADADIEKLLTMAKTTTAATTPGTAPVPSEINARDENQWTPMMHAASKGDLAAVKDLIRRGADVNLQDDNGWTSLMLAAHKGHTDVVRSLLVKGANPNVKTRKYTTALIVAAGRGHAEVVEMLLGAGADRQAKDAENKDAMAYATEKGHSEIINLLKKSPPVVTPPVPAGKADTIPVQAKKSPSPPLKIGTPALGVKTGKNGKAAAIVETANDSAPKLQKSMAATALLSSIMIVWIGILIGIHIFFSFCFKFICAKAGAPANFIIWIPILQVFPLLKAAGMAYWTFIFIFVPLANFVFIFWFTAKLCKARNKNPWLAALLIVPGGPLVLYPYLAFSD